MAAPADDSGHPMNLLLCLRIFLNQLFLFQLVEFGRDDDLAIWRVGIVVVILLVVILGGVKFL